MENNKVISNNIENKLLGLSLKDKHCFDNNVMNRINHNHFTIKYNSLIYRALEVVYNYGDAQEFETSDIVQAALKINEEVQEFGIENIDANKLIDYIASLLLESGIKSNVKKYMKQIKVNYDTLRYETLLQEQREELAKGKTVSEVSMKLNSLAMQIQDEENENFGEKPSTFFEESFNEIIDSKGKPLGFKTGWEKFDEVLGGIEKKTVLTIAARPSMGKTAFGVDLTYKLAENETPVCFFSAEMSADDISKRFITHKSGIGTRNLLNYDYINNHHKTEDLVRWAIDKVSEMPIIVDDHAGLSIEDIAWKMQKYSKDGYKVFVIDYVQYINVRSRIGQGKEHEKITFIMKELKTLAKKYNVAIVILAQIGRGIEKERAKRPTLSDIKGSGSIEENSDKVIALHRPWFYERGQTETANKKRANKIQELKVFVLKNRNGASRDITFHYWMDYNNFVEVDDNDSPQIMSYDKYVKEVVPFVMNKALANREADYTRDLPQQIELNY